MPEVRSCQRQRERSAALQVQVLVLLAAIVGKGDCLPLSAGEFGRTRFSDGSTTETPPNRRAAPQQGSRVRASERSRRDPANSVFCPTTVLPRHSTAKAACSQPAQ